MRWMMSVAIFASVVCACGDDAGGPASAASEMPSDVDGGSDGTSTTTEPSTVDMPYVQPGPWDGMTGEQKFEFMQKVVVPEMRTLFSQIDPKYAELGCKVCHGENGPDGAFKMPNGLAPLDTKDFPLDKSEDPRIASAAKFMAEQVTPKMAELLGRPPRSQDNPMGFGCFGCHARKD